MSAPTRQDASDLLRELYKVSDNWMWRHKDLIEDCIKKWYAQGKRDGGE